MFYQMVIARLVYHPDTFVFPRVMMATFQSLNQLFVMYHRQRLATLIATLIATLNLILNFKLTLAKRTHVWTKRLVIFLKLIKLYDMDYPKVTVHFVSNQAKHAHQYAKKDMHHKERESVMY
jgi:hypothetical protein